MQQGSLDPVAFELGTLKIHWYGIIISSAFLIAIFLATREARRRNIDPELILDLAIWIIPSAILGGRLFYVLFSWNAIDYSLLDIIAIWQGGLAIHGGMIGALIAGGFFAHYHDASFPQLTDIVAPSLVLGQAIGRWGNFINQEAYGRAVSRNWLESLHLPQWIIEQMQINNTYFHPTFLYESLWNLLIFLFLTFYWKKKDFLKPGDVFLTYISLYSLGRFFIEDIRIDSLMIGSWQAARIVSIAAILISGALAYYNHKLKGVEK